jgi:hypothetical protein
MIAIGRATATPNLSIVVLDAVMGRALSEQLMWLSPDR